MNLLDIFSLSRSISARNSLLILAIAIVIIFILIYSNKEFYTSSQDKIKTLKDLYELKATKNLDTSTIAYINNLQTKILKDHSIQENLSEYVSSIFNPYKKTIYSDGRNEFLNFVTASFFWIICIFAIPATKTNSTTNQTFKLYTDLKTFFVLLVLAIANAFIFNLVPVLWTPIVNYILNVFMQLAEIYLIIRLKKVKANMTQNAD
jgi:hypothetical protein